MKTHLKSAFTRAVLPLAALALAAPALAQSVDIGEILVTPNRTKTDKAKVGSTVETVTQEDIKQQSLPTVQDYLAQEPGVNIASQGGIGQETTLIVRGADKKYVKTLWNGIDLSDTSATQVQVSPEHLIIGGINNIEVLKGSQSTLYGADAVAGVIGISTLGDFEEGIRYIVSGEAGSFGTFRGHLGTQAATADGSRFAAGVTGLTTDGISAADARNGNTERDGYDNITVSLAGEKVLDANLTAFGALLYIDSTVDYDNGFAFPPVDAPNFTDRRQLAGRGGLSFTSDDGRTRTTAAVQINDISRQLNSFDPVFGAYIADYSSSRYKLDWLIEHDLNDRTTLQAGADYERTAFTRTDNYGSNDTGSPWIAGGWAQLIWTPVNDLTLTGAIRQDEHSNFGGFTTWRTTAAYLFQETGTKVRGSAGTGFRAPSPYELFTDPDGPTFCFPNPPGPPLCYGLAQQNPNLKPEESFSWDAGIDQSLLDGALTVSATYFQLDTDNLIDYVDDVGYTQIPGKTRRNGVETSLRWAVADWVDLTAAYTYTRSVEANGDRRPRVPQHDIVLGVFTRPAERWNTATTVRIVNDTVDIVGGNLVPLDDYVLVNAKVGYEPIDGLEVYIRGENLLDEKYQVVRGYGTPGASVFGGFTMQW